VALPQCSVMSSGRKETWSKQILRVCTVSRRLDGAGKNTMISLQCRCCELFNIRA